MPVVSCVCVSATPTVPCPVSDVTGRETETREARSNSYVLGILT